MTRTRTFGPDFGLGRFSRGPLHSLPGFGMSIPGDYPGLRRSPLERARGHGWGLTRPRALGRVLPPYASQEPGTPTGPLERPTPSPLSRARRQLRVGADARPGRTSDDYGQIVAPGGSRRDARTCAVGKTGSRSPRGVQNGARPRATSPRRRRSRAGSPCTNPDGPSTREPLSASRGRR